MVIFRSDYIFTLHEYLTFYFKLPRIIAAITIIIIPAHTVYDDAIFLSPKMKIPPKVETITSNCDNEKLVATPTFG